MTRISRAFLAFALVAGAGSAPVGCSGGVVGGECRSGYGACHGHCTDFRSDSDNCGTCGNVCPNSGSCVDSVCSGTGDASTGGASTGSGGAGTGTGGAGVGGKSTAGAGGVAVNAGGTSGAGGVAIGTGGTLSDAGTGGTTSTGGAGTGGSVSTLDGGGPDGSVSFDAGINCFPPYDTTDNCGTCHHHCVAPTPLCSPGNDKYVCTQLCSPPLTQCGDVCVNMDTDENNCGQCSKVCASGICQGGKCVGANAGHEVMICMDLQSQPASGAPQQRLLGNAIFLATSNPVRVLAFSEYAPAAVVTKVNNTLAAAAAARTRTYTLTQATTTLDVTNKLSIVNYDAFLVYDQSSAPAGVLSTIGSGLSGTVDSFVRAGGTAVVLAGDTGRAEMLDFLSAGGFMTATAQTGITGAQIYNRGPGDAVGLGVLSSFRAAKETCTFTVGAPDPFTSFVITDTSGPGPLGAPVVVHRVLAP